MAFFDELKSTIRKFPPLERVARFPKDRRYRLARKYVRGLGIEIGALDRPLMLPMRARAFYLDRLLPAQLRHHYPELNHRRLYVSFVADGEDMACVADGSLDFLIANHVIEHCEDPIATLTTVAAKLRRGGVLFMAVPDMRRTFDHKRRETPWEHLLLDHDRGPEISHRDHFREWATDVEGLSGTSAENRAEELFAAKYSIHFHCWTEEGFRSFLDHINQMLPLRVADAASWRNENIFILRRM